MAQHYWYDANGNMTRDGNKGIISLQYNHVNLVTRVQKRATQYIEYMYDAAGNKLCSMLVNGTGRNATQYIGKSNQGTKLGGADSDFFRYGVPTHSDSRRGVSAFVAKRGI